MTTQTDTLKIKLTTTGKGKVRASLAGVERDLGGVAGGANKTKKSIGGLQSAIALLTTTAAAGFLVKTIIEFEKLEASLRTVTGSTAIANKTFSELQVFAQETPSQLSDVVGAFIKLKALGLDPSIESLRSYGNTAAAMGKDLNQFIEAVADASTGEFERLKEFGIRARQQGDQVSFTFQGVTTTVQKSSAQIEGYLKAIGDTTFAGALTDQMNTLGGSFSNFQDSVSALAKKIGESGVSDAIKSITDASADLIRTMAGVPKPIDDLRKKLTALQAAEFNTPTKVYRPGRSTAVNTSRLINDVKDDIRDALIATGGPEGLRTQIDLLDEKIAEIEFKIANVGINRKPLAGLNRRLDSFNELARNARDTLAELELTAPEQQPGNAPSPAADNKAEKEKQRREKERQGYLDNLARRFNALQLSLSDETALINNEEQTRINLLNEYRENHILAEGEYQFRLTQIQDDASKKRTALVEAEQQEKFNITAGIFQNLTSLMGSQSKKQFEIGKKSALAGALIQGYAAVVASFKSGAETGGYPLAVAYAASATVAVKAQIDAIKRQQFSGGGTIPSISGGNNGQGTQPASTPPVDPTAQSGATQVVVQVIGPSYGYDDFDERIVGAVRTAVGNDVELVPADSRNGLELIEAANA